MSLFGALNAGVLGLAAQSNQLGVISDNIANVNTIGYKENTATFGTLVTSSSTVSAYSPGGVLSGTTDNISQQGVLQGTSSPTDIAISGSGFFVVTSQSGTTTTGVATTGTTTTGTETLNTGQISYTRAGSFTQDANGNFKNSAGFFLQAWKLDSSGNIPTNYNNTSSLTTVNVSNLTGKPTPTSTVDIVANLNSAQTVYPGAQGTMIPNANSLNGGVAATDLLVPEATAPKLGIGDNFKIATSNGTATTYTYGGLTYSNDVTKGSGGLGYTPVVRSLSTNSISVTTDASKNATVTITDAGNGLVNGDVVNIAGVATTNGVALSGAYQVANVDPVAGTYTLVLPSPTTGTLASTTTTTGATGASTASLSPTSGNILDATTTTSPFLGVTGTSLFGNGQAAGNPALTFTITSAQVTSTFTYTSASPNPTLGQFNTLANLATAINDTTGLNARVVNNQLYIGASDADNPITFANGQAAGTAGTPPLFGIDWIKELGITNTSSAPANTYYFSSMQGLANLINSNTAIGATAKINSPTSSASLSIATVDPLGTILFGDPSTGAVGPGDITGLFHLPTQAQGPAYSPSSNNMASGAVTPAFSRIITIYDAQGTPHQLTVGFIKTASNQWAAEVYDATANDTAPSQIEPIASGTIVFNPDGTLASDSGLTNMAASWSDGATSNITINLGTAGQIGTGKADGLSQYNSAYNVVSTNQNGAPSGQLSGVSITAAGFVVAAYSNGQTQNLYKIPLASFAAPNALSSASGNVYNQSANSGAVNLYAVGDSSVGKIAPSELEQSTADLATELTNMVIAQRAYQANTKTLSTVATMLDDLNQAIH